jgi:hypothetical protein
MCFSPCQSEGRTAWLHATWTEWKNLFSLEIYGRNGKLEIDGLGGSYGVESLNFYHMLPRWVRPRQRAGKDFPTALLLCGSSTPSLPAQGRQCLPQIFSINRDLPDRVCIGVELQG